MNGSFIRQPNPRLTPIYFSNIFRIALIGTTSEKKLKNFKG